MDTLTLSTKYRFKIIWTRLPDGHYSYTRVGDAGRLPFPPRGTRDAKHMALLTRSFCPTALNAVELELERLCWVDVLQEIRALRAADAAAGIPEPKPAQPEPPKPPKIDCWTLRDGLFLYEKTTPKVLYEQKVYYTEDKLFVDRWELGCSGRWEEEYYVAIDPKHFIALAVMLGIESPAPLALMQAIAARYSGEDAYETFHEDVDRHGVEHISRTRR